jgi:hypothetical protein
MPGRQVSKTFKQHVFRYLRKKQERSRVATGKLLGWGSEFNSTGQLHSEQV